MASWQSLRKIGCAAILSAMFGMAVDVRSAQAQPPASNPNEMCGTGETFTVVLPHLSTGTGGHDTIEVPRGCSIYLVIASDYGRNRELDELLFYPLAKYVAEHNGYVHYSWWNNFLKPYMAGPLHSKDKPTDPGPKTTIGMLESVFGLDLVGQTGRDEIYLNDFIRKGKLTSSTVGFWSTLLEQFMNFVKSTTINVPDDKQFVSDAGQFINAVRANNPNALVFLAGHGFGGHAIVKVAKNPNNTIDLLAPIDPLGTDTLPVGYRQLAEHNANPFTPNLDELSLDLGQYGHTNPHSRWRAVFDFKGYQTADCVRGAGPGGVLCQDFDPRILFFNLHCKPADANAWQSTTPLVFTLRPVSCPGPLVDPGKRISFGANVGFLYHRYQQEWGPPIDFGKAYHYGFRSPVTPNLQGPNVQGPILTGDIIFPPSSPYYTGGRRTCESGGPGCNLADGHDEVAGFRGEPTFHFGAELILTLTARGVQARDWPGDPASAANLRSSDTSANSTSRRNAMIEMASTTTNVSEFNCDFDTSIPGEAYWAHSPCTPDDCLVCEDLVTIASNLVAQHGEETPPASDTIAPTTLAAVDPEANANGWHQTDVVVTFDASDDTGGSGVRDIHYSTPSGLTIEQGNVAQAIITSEETTLLSFFATDNANNSGATNQLQLKIDKTLPQIDALTDAQPNVNGWFKTNVVVSFPAFDLLSGVAAVTPDTPVTSEGAGQDVEGTATDYADNQASASVTLNIDKTAPTISFASQTPIANAAGWHASDVTLSWNCVDSLSGPLSVGVTETVSAEGAAQLATGTCIDLADNSASETQAGINIDKTAPGITVASRTPANAAGWNNADVSVVWTCTDGLSGPVSPSVSGSRSSEGAGQTLAGTCVDLANNSGSVTESAINIDQTAPSVTIGAPANGAVLLLNAPAASSYACLDALSGVKSCNGPVPIGSPADTSSVGRKQFTVTASDLADNTASSTNTYTVQYGFSGFANPVAPMPMRNVANAGRTVPVKYVLRDANGGLIVDVATFVSLATTTAACDVAAPGVLTEETAAAGSTEIRWDAAAQQFIYNWKTDKAWAGSCRVLQLTLNDGTRHFALFQFK